MSLTPKPSTHEALLTTEEVLEYLQVSPRTVKMLEAAARALGAPAS
jgi:hypothetical protein